MVTRLFREQCKDTDNSFFIAMSSLLSLEQEHSNKVLVEQVSEINKNKFYYYFCYNIKDYVFQRKDTKGNFYYLVLPKFICIKTYIPNFKLYADFMKVIDCKVILPDTVMMERIDLVRQQKTLTDGNLLALNRLVFPFDSGNLMDKDDICSSLIAQMNQYSMKKLNYGPLKLACIQEELYLKVVSCNEAKRSAFLGYGGFQLPRDSYRSPQSRGSNLDLHVHSQRDQHRLRVGVHGEHHFCGVGFSKPVLSSTPPLALSDGRSLSSTVCLWSCSSTCNRPCLSYQASRWPKDHSSKMYTPT